MSRQVKKIAITGPESSGKTDLLQYLTRHLPHTLGIAEYARQYLESKPVGYEYTSFDVEHIAQVQRTQFLQADQHDALAVIFDSDFYVLDIWWQEVFGGEHPEITEMRKNFAFDLYLLCEPDLPWEFDPLRQNEFDRYRLFERYKKMLQDDGRQVIIVNGIGELRQQNALHSMIRFGLGMK